MTVMFEGDNCIGSGLGGLCNKFGVNCLGNDGLPPPKFNSSPLKKGGWNTTFLLKR